GGHGAREAHDAVQGAHRDLRELVVGLDQGALHRDHDGRVVRLLPDLVGRMLDRGARAVRRVGRGFTAGGEEGDEGEGEGERGTEGESGIHRGRSTTGGGSSPY